MRVARRLKHQQDTENQLIALREYCDKQGWQIAAEYVDHESGEHSRRPHFQEMFKEARARKFDLLLFWSLDRVSREGVSATISHLERLQDAGVEWRSFTEEYLDSTGMFRDAVIAILAVIAKQERIRRSERASAAIARLRRQGKADHLGRKRKLVRGQARDSTSIARRRLELASDWGESWRVTDDGPTRAGCALTAPRLLMNRAPILCVTAGAFTSISSSLPDVGGYRAV